MTAPVSIRVVSQGYGIALALNAVSLEDCGGEFFGLPGPSGCGKTTMPTPIGGFAEPTSGQILIGGRDLAGIAPVTPWWHNRCRIAAPSAVRERTAV